MAIKNSSVEPLATSWFMQDGTRPHQTNEVFSYILEYFDNHIIALNYPYFTEKGMQWPPCSIDLNLCDFFLWGHLKDANTSKNPEHLRNVKKKEKKTFSYECAAIPQATFDKMAANFVLRLQYEFTADGGHFENIVKWFSFI